jgi:UDP-3-O-[3-hydroxymyristoyl] glucosamine N-acyltransferase
LFGEIIMTIALIDLKKIEPSLELPAAGDWDHLVNGICSLVEPIANHIAFAKDAKSLELLTEHVSVLLLPKALWQADPTIALSLIQQRKVDIVATADDVMLAVCKLSKKFYDILRSSENDHIDGRQMGTTVIHPTAFIAQGAFIGQGVQIGAGTTIYSGVVVMSGSVIGENCVLYPNSSLHTNVKLGNRVRIHSGTVIGADGFGYYFKDGVHHKIWHMGGVEIGDDVEIGANSCVDGGTFFPTRIGAGSKIDNHVQIAHNDQVGRGVIICGHVAIGGSSTIGDFTVFGGKSALGDNVKLGKGVQVAGGAMVNTSWEDGAVLGGHPARPIKEWLKGLAFVRKASLGSKKE